MNKLKNKSGITLIALVVTIIVLLILAGISIQMLTGDNGILNRAGEARSKTIHANVLEQMQLEANAYIIDKTTGTYSNTLIDYLKLKSIISDISGEENKWKIDVTTLLGSNQSMGNGTYPNDVYTLEQQIPPEGNVISTKVASTTPIKVSATSTSQVTYKVVYHENGTSEGLEIGILTDSNGSSSIATGDLGVLKTFYMGNSYEDVGDSQTINGMSAEFLHDNNNGNDNYWEYILYNNNIDLHILLSCLMILLSHPL